MGLEAYICSLTSAVDGVGGQSQTPRSLYLRERPDTPCIGGWVSPSAILDECGKFYPRRNSFSRPPSSWRFAVQGEPYRPTLCRYTQRYTYAVPLSSTHTEDTFHFLHTSIFHSTTCFGHLPCSCSITKTQTAFQDPINCLCLYNIFASRCVAETCSNIIT